MFNDNNILLDINFESFVYLAQDLAHDWDV